MANRTAVSIAFRFGVDEPGGGVEPQAGLNIPAAQQQDEVIQPHRDAERF
jgi:hypothetical protein